MLTKNQIRKTTYLKSRLGKIGEFLHSKIDLMDDEAVPLSKPRVAKMKGLVDLFVSNMKDQLTSYVEDGNSLSTVENISSGSDATKYGEILNRARRSVTVTPEDGLAQELFRVANSNSSMIGWNDFDGGDDEEDEPDFDDGPVPRDYPTRDSFSYESDPASSAREASFLNHRNRIMALSRCLATDANGKYYIRASGYSTEFRYSFRDEIPGRPEEYNPNCVCMDCVLWTLHLCVSIAQPGRSHIGDTDCPCAVCIDANTIESSENIRRHLLNGSGINEFLNEILPTT